MYKQKIELLNKLLEIAYNQNKTENKWLEFKINNLNQIGEYISALANGAFWDDQEYAYIIFGVEDKTINLVGVDFDPFNPPNQFAKTPLELWLNQKITGCSFEFLPFKHNNLNFLIVKISSISSAVAKFDDKAYFRIGEHKKLLKDIPEWESRLWKKIHSKRQKTILTKAIKLNLRQDEVLELLDYKVYYQLINSNPDFPIPTNQDLIISRFVDEGFIVSNGVNYNILGIGAILFAKNLKNFEELRYKVPEVITYNGTHKLDPVVKTQIGTKGYAAGFLGLVDYIFTQIKEPETIKIIRSKKAIYPQIAIREMVANALIHQDLCIGTRVMIEIYNDHIDISNGGGCLFDTIKIIGHSPISRNEQLAEAMRRLNLCERRGSGVDRAIDEIQKIQLPPPKFIDQGIAFIVKLYSHRKYAEFTEEEKQRACVQFVELNYEQGKTTTNEELRIRFGISKQSASIISRLVKKCVEKKLIKKFDPKSESRKNTSYIPFYA